MLAGIKTAILVQAPAVYHAFENDEEDSGGVTGACAPELAETMFTTITSAYPGLINIIGTSWQWTVLDSQFQTKGFPNKLWNLLKKSQCTFTDVIWVYLKEKLDNRKQASVNQSHLCNALCNIANSRVSKTYLFSSCVHGDVRGIP